MNLDAIRKAAGGRPQCDKHPDRPASDLRLDTGEARCRECRSVDDPLCRRCERGGMMRTKVDRLWYCKRCKVYTTVREVKG